MNFPNKTSRLVVLFALLSSLNGCSTIKSYFPDKEKEYVNSIEIAPLVIPPDLSNSAIIQEQSITDRQVTVNDVNVGANETKTKTGTKPDRVRLVSYTGGATRLQIDEPYVRAWRIVGKSLSRKSLEIIERNINEGLFLIQYDPNEKDIEDGSLWDEFLFIFGDEQKNEKEYQIRLVENKDQTQTEVLVLDQQGTPLYQGIGLNLLNLMYDAIKVDLAKQ